MSHSPELWITANLHLIGMIFTCATLGGLSLITFFYIYYVQKHTFARYAAYVFTVLALALLADTISLIDVLGSSLSEPKVIHTLIAYYADLLIIFLLHKSAAHSWHRFSLIKQNILMAMSLLIALQLYFRPDYTYLLALYAFVVLSICQYYHAADRKRISPIAMMLLTLMYTSVTIHYVVIYGMSAEIRDTFIRFEWLFILLATYVILAYVFVNYKLLVEQKDQLNDRLIHDSLTGLYSRNYFNETVKDIEEGWILFIDINDFKWINDSLGHAYGDQILQLFGDSLEVFDNDRVICARYGGDEFAVILIGYDETEMTLIAREICDQFKKDIAEVTWSYSRHQKVTLECPSTVGISIGVARLQNYQWNEAMLAADQHMYMAKQLGNYQIVQGGGQIESI